MRQTGYGNRSKRRKTELKSVEDLDLDGLFKLFLLKTRYRRSALTIKLGYWINETTHTRTHAHAHAHTHIHTQAHTHARMHTQIHFVFIKLCIVEHLTLHVVQPWNIPTDSWFKLFTGSFIGLKILFILRKYRNFLVFCL